MDRKEAERLLSETRKELERVTGEMLNLLDKRQALSREIRKAKQVLGIPPEVPAREAELMEKLGKENPGREELLRLLFRLSKEEQNRQQ